jgi:hypothetical protein
MADDANDPATNDASGDTEIDGELAADPVEVDGEPEPVDEPDAPVSEAKKKADAVIAERRAKSAGAATGASAERKVERRVVTSRRVTPKPGAKPGAADAPAAASKARDAKKTEAVVSRTPPAQQQQAYAKGPSPWWVPALMFGLIILGGLAIMLNYMGAFGDPDNTRLVLGLALILGGIITATQYR